jgi:hypothetical protein
MTKFKRKKSRVLTPWSAFVILAVLLVAFGLKIADVLKAPKVPTAQVPSVSYEQVVGADTVTPETPTTLPVAEQAPEITEEVPVPETSTSAPTTTTADKPLALPVEFNLAVPFTSQAPTGNWDEIHNDTCEEATVLMIAEFYSGRPAGKMDPDFVDPILLKMVALQDDLGMGYSISAAETVRFIKSYYNLNAVIVDNPTVEQIKQIISEGKPVILPAAGRELGNPFFTGEGPLYHMLAIRGYTQDKFITNDPGTRHGDNYIYSIDTVMSAMADWNNGDPYTGAKRIIYIEP